MEFTCIACEFKYSQDTGDVEERMCNKCLDEIRTEFGDDFIISDRDSQKSWIESPQFKKVIKDIESQVDNMDNKSIADIIALLNNYRIAYDIIMESLNESKLVSKIKENLK